MQVMPVKTARFTEKLTKLGAGISKAELARAGGVSSQQIQNYLDGASPRHYTALLLARYFEVDPVWFMDEDQPWRDDYPELSGKPSNPAKQATDDELLDEVAYRCHHRVRWFLDLMVNLNAVDWDRVWEAVKTLEPGDTLPPDLEEVAEMLRVRGHFPHVHPLQFRPLSIPRRKIDLGDIKPIDVEKFEFFELSNITVGQREQHPKLELVHSRLGALKLLPGNSKISGPDALK